MDRSLKDHIACLEQRIEHLKTQQDDLGLTAEERFQAVIDLGFAESALSSFRQALEFEKRAQQNSSLGPSPGLSRTGCESP
jgi:nitric oxide reductase activation protein